MVAELAACIPAAIPLNNDKRLNGDAKFPYGVVRNGPLDCSITSIIVNTDTTTTGTVIGSMIIIVEYRFMA